MTQYTKYIGVFTEEMFDMGAEESPFQDEKGNEYEFEVQYHPEGDGNGFIRITDSIGRVVPVDISHVSELISALLEVERASLIALIQHKSLEASGW